MSRPLALGIAAALAATSALAAPPPATPARKPTPQQTAPEPAKPKLDLAYGAYQRGQFISARLEATARLDKNPNDAAAMTLMGELYNQGLGVKQSSTDAAAWYRLAAQKGDAHAMATLGLMSIDGRGMARDPQAGRAWLEKAAALREPVASYNLALILLAGGSDAEITRAARLLVIATEAEIGDAQHALGVMHSRGLGGVAHDQGAAARLYLRAARNGSLSGEVEFAIAQANGDGVPKDEVGASRHFRLAAARGNAIAQNRLARMYATGRGVQKNLVEAAAWNLAASAQGLQDKWLDEAVSEMPKADRKRAEALAAERAKT